MNSKKNTISKNTLKYSDKKIKRHRAQRGVSFPYVFQAGENQPAMAMPMLMPPMAIRMHIRISTIRMMIFVDFFMLCYPFGTKVLTI